MENFLQNSNEPGENTRDSPVHFCKNPLSEDCPYLESVPSPLRSCLLSAPYSSIAEYAGTMLTSTLQQTEAIELTFVAHIPALLHLFPLHSALPLANNATKRALF